MQCTNMACCREKLPAQRQDGRHRYQRGGMKGKEYPVREKNGRTDAMHLLTIKLSINFSEFNGSKVAIDHVTTVVAHPSLSEPRSGTVAKRHADSASTLPPITCGLPADPPRKTIIQIYSTKCARTMSGGGSHETVAYHINRRDNAQ